MSREIDGTSRWRWFTYNGRSGMATARHFVVSQRATPRRREDELFFSFLCSMTRLSPEILPRCKHFGLMLNTLNAGGYWEVINSNEKYAIILLNCAVLSFFISQCTLLHYNTEMFRNNYRFTEWNTVIWFGRDHRWSTRRQCRTQASCLRKFTVS